MAKIDRLKDLPEWFTLEKYREAEFFSINDWVNSLRIRKIIFDSINAIEGLGMLAPELFGVLKELEQELQQLRRNPLDLNACQCWASFIGNFEKNPGIASVRNMTFPDLVAQFRLDHHGAENGDLAEIQANRWKLIATPSHVVTPTELIDMPVGTMLAKCEPLLVDMRATDSVLIAAFSAWLKDARKANTSSKRNKPEYGRWAGYGLLPYLDLLIWAIETGNHIPRHVMSAAVSRYNKGDSAFSKTVATLAADLMSDLSELQTLAAFEATLRTSEKQETFGS